MSYPVWSGYIDALRDAWASQDWVRYRRLVDAVRVDERLDDDERGDIWLMIYPLMGNWERD